ncbi:PIN domain-containing protein [Kitasatospora sp. NPDC094015]|uniref:PIN domain-containing protein n=1 Tax=Kitasatospora sp. NPDC094015 TaxID=3155205 RepID=UPI0033206608
MRLKPGVTLDSAETTLRAALVEWENARGAQDYFQAYVDAVEKTFRPLQYAFAEPDLAGGLRTEVYRHILQLGNPNRVTFRGTAPYVTSPTGGGEEIRARNGVLAAEIEHQAAAMTSATEELRALKLLAGRPGLPVVYDTNMLNHWAQPGDVRWREVLKEQGEDTRLVRLIVPLRVLDELDRQKYGTGALAKKAATAIRYLDRVLSGHEPAAPVDLRPGEATLEVWHDGDHRDIDTDLAILRCTADLANLHPTTGARTLTDDIGMRLRAHHMGLATLRLPEQYRKKGTAMDEVPPQV